MSADFWIAMLSIVGTLIGSGAGVVASSRLTNFRIKRLEEKVEKHNNVLERTALLEKDMDVANHRIKDLEEEHKNEEHKNEKHY